MTTRREPSTPAPLSAIDALAVAACLCRERGVQLTEMRQRMLEALWRAEGPLGAYELLPRLEAAVGRKLTPPTVYRTLDFLVRQKLAARIESRNAYTPCCYPGHDHACVFFVCDRCSRSVEIESHELEQHIAHSAAALGFTLSRQVLELQGLCTECLGTA